MTGFCKYWNSVEVHMNCCEQLTDNGLLLILQLCGSTLRYLNISGTEETEENMSEYEVKLSC